MSATFVRLAGRASLPWTIGFPTFLPRLVVAALICVLAADAARMVWRGRNAGFAASGTQAAAHHAPPRTARLRTLAANRQVTSIRAANLFGAAPALAQTVAVADSSLRLKGVFAYTDSALGFAFLGDANGQSVVLLRTGEITPDGAVLREVWADHVVIERGGRLLTVPLEQSAHGLPTGDRVALAPVAQSSEAQPRSMESLVSYYTPEGVPPGLTFASRLAMEMEQREAAEGRQAQPQVPRNQ